MSKKEKPSTEVTDQQQGDQHNISDDEIHFKAEKLELDRQLSHLVLDKEILVKNHDMLHQQIEKKTEGLYEQRTVLEEKRNGIQVRRSFLKLIQKMNLLDFLGRHLFAFTKYTFQDILFQELGVAQL